MDNFEIKERIRELICKIYKYNCVGGALHLVIDNHNFEDCHIQYCLDNQIAEIKNEEEKQVYKECAELLLKLSYSSRKRLIRPY